MKELLWFLVTFALLYLGFYVLILKNKKSLQKYKTSREVTYLVKRYHLNLDKIDFKKFASDLFLMNDFILSLTVSIIMNITANIFLIIILAVIIIVSLILIGYSLIGKHYKRKENEYV